MFFVQRARRGHIVVHSPLSFTAAPPFVQPARAGLSLAEDALVHILCTHMIVGSSSAPSVGLWARLRAFAELTKPRIGLLLLAVAACSYYLGSGRSFDSGRFAILICRSGSPGSRRVEPQPVLRARAGRAHAAYKGKAPAKRAAAPPSGADFRAGRNRIFRPALCPCRQPDQRGGRPLYAGQLCPYLHSAENQDRVSHHPGRLERRHPDSPGMGGCARVPGARRRGSCSRCSSSGSFPIFLPSTSCTGKTTRARASAFCPGKILAARGRRLPSSRPRCFFSPRVSFLFP